MILLGQRAGHGRSTGLAVIGGQEDVGVGDQIAVPREHGVPAVFAARGGRNVGDLKEPVMTGAELRRSFGGLCIEGTDHFQNDLRIFRSQFHDGLRRKHIHAHCTAGNEMAKSHVIERSNGILDALLEFDATRV